MKEVIGKGSREEDKEREEEKKTDRRTYRGIINNEER